jgi:hypothetical protein
LLVNVSSSERERWDRWKLMWWGEVVIQDRESTSETIIAEKPVLRGE